MAQSKSADPVVQTERLNQTFRLRNGRRLGFAEYGPPDGEPMFYFHGWPSSRLEVKLAEGIFYEAGARIVAIDRPGYGLSEFLANRKLTDWPGDVSELADHLGMDKFGIIGTSGGGPYAAVCSRFLSHRLTRVLLICPLSPLTGEGTTNGMTTINRVMVMLASRTPRVAQMVSGLCLEYARRQDCVVFPPKLEASLGEADRQALAQPAFRNLLLESSREAFRQGVRGASWDACLYSRPWGFRLKEIDAPVYVWHGESDRIVPVSNGKRYASAIPKCRAFFFPDDGHFSLPFTRIREIISSISP
jgi:pimeloyl-ACP methyl ester carboxylesterase